MHGVKLIVEIKHVQTSNLVTYQLRALSNKRQHVSRYNIINFVNDSAKKMNYGQEKAKMNNSALYSKFKGQN